MDIPIELAVLGVVVLGIALSAVHWLWRRRRIAGLVRWARENGWTYRASDDSVAGGFRGEPFDGSDTTTAGQVVSGTYRDREVVVFKYRYTSRSDVGDGDSKSTDYEVIAVRLPGPTPMLQVAPEHVGHKLLDLVGVHDLQVGDTEFDDAFRITTEDDAFARAVLSPELRRLHLDGPRSLPFRCTGGYLLTWEQITGAVDIIVGLAKADHLIDLADRVPDHLFGPSLERSAD